MPFHRIQYRLILFFVFLVVVILFIGGWTLRWKIRQSLEAELGRKLIAVAWAASVQFGEGEVELLIQGVGTRTENYLKQNLFRLKETTGVKRIYLFDLSGTSLLDTEKDIDREDVYFNLRFYRDEMGKIRGGEAAYTVLFMGIDGQPTMTGYAPLILNETIVGGVGVDGSVTFLDAVVQMQNRLYLIGVLGTCAAIILGVIMARSITRPIDKLVKISKRIGRGDYSETIPPQGKGEIGLLAETMEEMRRGVVGRERELKAMLAGVAHEIRNPLGGIELFAGILLDEVSGDSEARDHVKRIVKEVAQLKRIVESFLIYAKPQEPNREICPLAEILVEVSRLLEGSMRKQNIHFIITKQQDPVELWADPSHLKQIFLNIMQNAVQAMPDGGEIRIRWQETNASVSIRFEDTGEGIPGENHDHIFMPFFTTREKGTGLGLSIVKELIQVNNGHIRLVRSDHTGTTLELTLPKYDPGV